MTGAVCVFDVARRICDQKGWTLSNMALQKLAYLAHMVFLGRSGGQPLIREEFEAWNLGPIVPELYQRVKRFGDKAIQDVFWDACPIKDEAMRKAIDDVVDSFASMTPGQLVTLTHHKDGAWARHFDRHVRGITIPNEDILREYRDRVNDD